jgi:succinate-semialdehyde dehydrogenase/glutarate-semialdehyde dehydrogenase
MTNQSTNPNDGKQLKSFAYQSDGELDSALATAAGCFQRWKHKNYAELAAILTKAAELLHAHVDDFARLETLEMGKRIDEARGKVNFSAEILGYYAQHAESFLAPTPLRPMRGKAHMQPASADTHLAYIGWLTIS